MVGLLRRTSEPSADGPAHEAGRTGHALVRQPVFGRAEELVGQRVISTALGSGAPGGYLASMPQSADGELLLAEDLHGLAPRGLVFLTLSRSELIDLRALSLPSARVVLCLRGGGPFDDDLCEAVDRHSMRGFRLALDGLSRADSAGPLLGKVGTAVLDVEGWSPEPLAEFVASVRDQVAPRELVAAGVHSRACFEDCKRIGFDLFQGQFFLKPNGGPKRRAARAGLGGLGVMAELAVADDFERLAAVITRDPGLSLRLLRYANSAHAALPRRVGSVHEALAWLGTVTVREFSLIATVSNIEAGPAEMLVTALTRARMCQQLARSVPACTPEEAFTVGLFSVAESAANAPIAEVVGELPLREDVARALVGGSGPLGGLLTAVVTWERGDFAESRRLVAGRNDLGATYLEALHWADSAVKAVS